jgi:hypothetical protein
MITPPRFVNSFYTTLLEQPIAQELIKLVSPSRAGDVLQVLITSDDIPSDVQATMSAGSRSIACSPRPR